MSEYTTQIDPSHYRQVLGQYPTGVVVVTAGQPEGPPAALTIGSFTSVSLDPTLVAFYPDKTSTSWPKIREQGHFVVNILGADQESLCRSFARSGTDKFEGVSWRPGSSGAPIIEGAVAWVECRLHSVQDVGDHYLVIGEVIDLRMESGALPLLFFRGGYGRFTPTSLTAADVSLASYLPTIDLVRPELEAIAEHCSSECIIAAHIADEFVVLAAARSTENSRAPMRGGRRFACTAPMGPIFAAWGTPADLERWAASRGTLTAAERLTWAQWAREIRSRGYVVGLGDQAYTQLEDTLLRAGTTNYVKPDASIETALESVRPGLEYQGPLDLEASYELRSLSVPVFSPDGILQVGLYGLTGMLSGRTITSFGHRLLEGAERATDLLGGSFPTFADTSDEEVTL